MSVPYDDDGPDYSFPDHLVHLENFGDDTNETLRIVCSCGWSNKITDIQATNGSWHAIAEHHRNKHGLFS